MSPPSRTLSAFFIRTPSSPTKTATFCPVSLPLLLWPGPFCFFSHFFADTLLRITPPRATMVQTSTIVTATVATAATAIVGMLIRLAGLSPGCHSSHGCTVLTFLPSLRRLRRLVRLPPPHPGRVPPRPQKKRASSSTRREGGGRGLDAAPTRRHQGQGRRGQGGGLPSRRRGARSLLQ